MRASPQPFGATEVINIRPYRKSVIQTDGGYTQLWIAVINQAVNDYRNNPEMRSEVARFFKSEYFERMTGVSGQVVLDRLKKEVKQNKNNIHNECYKTNTYKLFIFIFSSHFNLNFFILFCTFISFEEKTHEVN